MKKLTYITLLLFASCTNPTSGDKIPTTEKSDSLADVNKSNIDNEIQLEQNYFKFDNFRRDEQFAQNLTQFELSDSEKKKLVDKVRNHYEYIETSEFHKDEPLVESLLFLELNGDGKPDLLFQGWSGGEADCFNIHLSSENGFSKPISFYQHLKDMKIEDNKLKYLTVLDFGCCAAYVQKELVYRFDEEFKPTLVFQRGRVEELPDNIKILNDPIEFTVENEIYKLRSQPTIDDSSTISYDHPDHGNIIAIFNKGATGKAWAIDSSDSQRVWWYVEMDSISGSLELDLFEYYDEGGRLRRLGWMSSRFLDGID